MNQVVRAAERMLPASLANPAAAIARKIPLPRLENRLVCLAQFELSRRIGIETASSTAAIDQLERLGLIRRRRDSADRRRVIVTLTEAGRKLEGPLDGCAVAVNKRARSHISKEEIAALFDTVKKIIANLREK
jgi:DNA-binding MarR family transcriptional regulator